MYFTYFISFNPANKTRIRNCVTGIWKGIGFKERKERKGRKEGRKRKRKRKRKKEMNLIYEHFVRRKNFLKVQVTSASKQDGEVVQAGGWYISKL